jgi:hypothetical protein
MKKLSKFELLLNVRENSLVLPQSAMKPFPKKQKKPNEIAILGYKESELRKTNTEPM